MTETERDLCERMEETAAMLDVADRQAGEYGAAFTDGCRHAAAEIRYALKVEGREGRRL